MVDAWGRPEMKDWMYLMHGMKNVQEIKKGRLELEMAKASGDYANGAERATKALSNMTALKDPDGSVPKVNEKEYYGHLEELTGVWDIVNTERDFVPDSFQKDTRKRGTQWTVEEIDHTTGDVRRVPVPSEDSIKEVLGNYYEMKGATVRQTKDGFMKFKDVFLATQQEILEWNTDSREKANIYTNDKGENVRVYRVRDGKGDGSGHMMYENESDHSLDATGDEGLDMLVKGGYKPATQRAEEALVKQREAATAASEVRATHTKQLIAKEDIDKRDRLIAKRTSEHGQDLEDKIRALGGGLSIKDGNVIGPGGTELTSEQQQQVNALTERTRAKIAYDTNLITTQNLSTKKGYDDAVAVEEGKATAKKKKIKKLKEATKYKRLGTGMTSPITGRKRSDESPLAGGQLKEGPGIFGDTTDKLPVAKKTVEATGIPEREVGEYGGLISQAAKIPEEVGRVAREGIEGVEKDVRILGKETLKFWEGEGPFTQSEINRIKQKERRGL